MDIITGTVPGEMKTIKLDKEWKTEDHLLVIECEQFILGHHDEQAVDS